MTELKCKSCGKTGSAPQCCGADMKPESGCCQAACCEPKQGEKYVCASCGKKVDSPSCCGKPMTCCD